MRRPEVNQCYKEWSGKHKLTSFPRVRHLIGSYKHHAVNDITQTKKKFGATKKFSVPLWCDRNIVKNIWGILKNKDKNCNIIVFSKENRKNISYHNCRLLSLHTLCFVQANSNDNLLLIQFLILKKYCFDNKTVRSSNPTGKHCIYSMSWRAFSFPRLKGLSYFWLDDIENAGFWTILMFSTD